MHSRAHIHLPTGVSDKIADVVTSFVGSWLCIGLHAAWFTVWIVLHVEPFPFGLLTMIVSLEAIFLSTLVMISQNRQAEKDHKRDNLEAEEVTMLLKLNEQQLEILQLLRDQQARRARPVAKRGVPNE